MHPDVSPRLSTLPRPIARSRLCIPYHEELPQPFSQRGIVLDQQYRFSAGTEIEHVLHDFWMSRFCSARQQRVKNGSVAGLAFHPNISAALFHDAINGSETETGPFP